MHSYLEKVLNLAKKTGDRIIVVDQKNPQNCYVVMNLDEYEGLIDNVGEMFNMPEVNWDNIEKNTADISEEINETDEFENFNEDIPEMEAYDFSEKLDNYADSDKINNTSQNILDNKTDSKKRWEIAEDIKRVGQEESSDLNNEDNYSTTFSEDDRYYLETI